jgi:hypothetical protein
MVPMFVESVIGKSNKILESRMHREAIDQGGPSI